MPASLQHVSCSQLEVVFASTSSAVGHLVAIRAALMARHLPEWRGQGAESGNRSRGPVFPDVQVVKAATSLRCCEVPFGGKTCRWQNLYKHPVSLGKLCYTQCHVWSQCFRRADWVERWVGSSGPLRCATARHPLVPTGYGHRRDFTHRSSGGYGLQICC